MLYLLFTNQFQNVISQQFSNLEDNEWNYIIIVSIIGIISGIAWISLVKDNFISYIVPHIQPLIIILTFIISYFIVKEPITNYHLIGAVLIIFGLILINEGKKINQKIKK